MTAGFGQRYWLFVTKIEEGQIHVALRDDVDCDD